jgi:release factor glutamine methyltransferase
VTPTAETTSSPDAATIASIAQRTTARLVVCGHEPAAARQDVGVLARHVLRWDAATWLAHQHAPAPPDFAAALLRLVEQRAAHRPVAYILGEREFYGRPFRVSEAVLIPRPETEGVVDAALEVLRNPARTARGNPPRILDIGTGSGCLAITLALEAGVRVDATDTSADALAVARENAARLGVTGAVTFRETSLAGAVRDVDVVVTNPPYVPMRDRPTLAPDVRDHEPSAALFGGEDGLDVIRALLPEAARALRPGGSLIMEIGQGQAAAIEALVGLAGLQWIGARADLAGIPRVVVARAVAPD